MTGWEAASLVQSMSFSVHLRPSKVCMKAMISAAETAWQTLRPTLLPQRLVAAEPGAVTVPLFPSSLEFYQSAVYLETLLS